MYICVIVVKDLSVFQNIIDNIVDYVAHVVAWTCVKCWHRSAIDTDSISNILHVFRRRTANVVVTHVN